MIRALRAKKALRETRILAVTRYNSVDSLGGLDTYCNDNATKQLGIRYNYFSIHEFLDMLHVNENDQNHTLPGRNVYNLTDEDMKEKESAQKCADSILQDPALDFEGFERIFTRYLCYKFMLDPAELTPDNFYEICQLSAEKSSSLPKGMLDAAELASKCGGATTAMNKKVLFLLNVNETYHITITAEESVKIETFTQLKQLIYSKLQEKRGS